MSKVDVPADWETYIITSYEFSYIQDKLVDAGVSFVMTHVDADYYLEVPPEWRNRVGLWVFDAIQHQRAVRIHVMTVKENQAPNETE